MHLSYMYMCYCTSTVHVQYMHILTLMYSNEAMFSELHLAVCNVQELIMLKCSPAVPFSGHVGGRLTSINSTMYSMRGFTTHICFSWLVGFEGQQSGERLYRKSGNFRC